MRNPYIETTETFLGYISHPPEIRELRGLGAKGVMRHLSTDTHSLARSAHAMEAMGASVFFTLNPINPESPYGQRHVTSKPIRGARHTARDKDMLHRSIYLVDIDPVRPSGMPSTDAEKAAASKTVTEVRDYLTGKGWPEPILIDSGNGYHLLYRGDQTAPTSQVWPYVLRELAGLFDNEDAHVDTTVHNAARVSRLPGTLNAKGTATAERPHRRAQVLHYPDQWLPVSHGPLVYGLAHDLGYRSNRQNAAKQRPSTSDLVLDDAGVYRLAAEFPDHLQITHTKETDDMTLYVLDSCPFAGRPHSGSCDKTVLTLSSTSLGFKCLSDDCEGKGWKDLKALLYKQTGRWPKTRIYKSKFEATAEDELDAWMRAKTEYRQSKLPEWQYDSETHRIIASEAFKSREWPTDPAAWGLTWNQVRHAYYAEAKRLLERSPIAEREVLDNKIAENYRSEDLTASGEFLGAEYLFVLKRNVDRPAIRREWEIMSNAAFDRMEKHMFDPGPHPEAFAKTAKTALDWAHGEGGLRELGIRGFC